MIVRVGATGSYTLNKLDGATSAQDVECYASYEVLSIKFSLKVLSIKYFLSILIIVPILKSISGS